MEKLERRETRYFFQSTRLLKILPIIREIIGQELSYQFPVTQTIYFTLGHEHKYAFPHGMRVRARGYIAALAKHLVVDRSPVFLEIKQEFDKDTNQKRRIPANCLQAVEMLEKPNGFGEMPSLFPYAATQSLRHHWTIGKGGRLTLDEDIRLFGFQDNRPFEAEHVCDFDEGKIEFKLEDNNHLAVETRIVEATGVVWHEYSYLERKTRQCMHAWLNRKQD